MRAGQTAARQLRIGGKVDDDDDGAAAAVFLSSRETERNATHIRKSMWRACTVRT